MPPLLTDDSMIQTSSQQVSCELVAEAVILNLPEGKYYSLDAIGTRVWALIQQPCSLREIRETLLHEYDVDHEQCERELRRLLEELRAHGLVTIQDEKAT